MSFTLLETINHVLEPGRKVFSWFLDIREVFDTVWIDCLIIFRVWDRGQNVAGHLRSLY